MTPSSAPERFELSLAGGASEALYRRLRPDVERLPWERAWKVDASPEQVTEARVQWTLAALQSEVLRAMVRARVPLDLSAVASSFSLDELAHAEVCARVAHALGGGAPVSYAPDQVFSLRAPGRDGPALDEAAWRVVESSARSQVAALRANWRGVSAVPTAAFSAISPLGDGGAGAYQQRAARALRHHVLAAFARLGIDANPPA